MNAFLQFLMQEDLDHFMEHEIQRKDNRKAISYKESSKVGIQFYEFHSFCVLQQNMYNNLEK